MTPEDIQLIRILWAQMPEKTKADRDLIRRKFEITAAQFCEATGEEPVRRGRPLSDESVIDMLRRLEPFTAAQLIPEIAKDSAAARRRIFTWKKKGIIKRVDPKFLPESVRVAVWVTTKGEHHAGS